jgi:hypothetical protein
LLHKHAAEKTLQVNWLIAAWNIDIAWHVSETERGATDVECIASPVAYIPVLSA